MNFQTGSSFFFIQFLDVLVCYCRKPGSRRHMLQKKRHLSDDYQSMLKAYLLMLDKQDKQIL